MLDFPQASVLPSGLADWIEITVLFGDSGHLSRSALVDVLGEGSGLEDLAAYDSSYDPDAAEDARDTRPEELYLASEALVDDALQELSSRREVVGASYPLTITSSLVERRVPRWIDAPVYAFLCALNARHVYRLGEDFLTAARLFERLTVPALSAYWGGRSMRFGSPRTGDDPRQFGEALTQLAATMGERLTWATEELPRHTGDMSVDVAAWRPLDHRRGHTVLLCQCAIGGDWETKSLELDVWRAMISFAVAPSKALAFPFVPEALSDFSAFDWEMMCARVGVPFDRLRIAQLLGGAAVPTELLEDMVTWTTGVSSVLA